MTPMDSHFHHQYRFPLLPPIQAQQLVYEGDDKPKPARTASYEETTLRGRTSSSALASASSVPASPGASSPQENVKKLNEQGKLLLRKGDYGGSFQTHNKALNICVESLGPSSPETAASYNGMGESTLKLGQFEKAIEYHQAALAICQVSLGSSHPETANCFDGLGSAYERLKFFDKSLEFHNKALSIRVSAFGPKHPETARSYYGLGWTNLIANEMDACLEYFQKAHAIRLESFGTNSPESADAITALGYAYDGKGDTDKGIELIQQGLSIRLAVLGPNHPGLSGTAFYRLSHNNIVVIQTWPTLTTRWAMSTPAKGMRTKPSSTTPRYSRFVSRAWASAIPAPS